MRLYVTNIDDFIKVTTVSYPVTIKIEDITWYGMPCIRVQGVSKQDLSMLVICEIYVHENFVKEEVEKIKRKLEDIGYTVVEGEYIGR